MENIPLEIFDLLDSKSFEELTENERVLVNEWMSEAAYRLQHRILTESANLDYEIPLVEALAIPEKSIPFWQKPIPLWQAMSGVAAAMLILFLFPKSTENNPNLQASKPLVQHVHDTIVQQLPGDTIFQVTTRILIDTVFLSVQPQIAAQRMLEAPKNLYIPLKDAYSNVSSVSLKDEKNKISLPEMVFSLGD